MARPCPLSLLLLTLTFFLLLSPALGADVGLRCKDHPALDKTSTPVLIRSWKFLGRRTQIFVNNRIVYVPRLTAKFNYVPIPPPAPVDMDVPGPTDDPMTTEPPVSSRFSTSPDKYRGLDFFVMAGNRNVRSPFALKMYLQRAAKLYLFVNTLSYDAANPVDATLRGWQSEGWADLGRPQQALVYGVHQKTAFRATKYAYVFSKKTRGRNHVAYLPQVGWVMRNIQGIVANGQYHIRVAEADGSPSVKPGLFRGVDIKPNRRCPDVLHNAWSTFDNNNDPHTQGMTFRTWHPQWDPCYWCAFDHEHGSAAPFLMGYQPKYGLTELKNTGGVEPNPGFKDTVIKQDGLSIYFSIHAQTSSLRRVNARFHTVTIAVRDETTKELVVELSFKGDFGFLAGRRAGNVNRFLALTPEGLELQNQQKKAIPFKRALRTINVIDAANLDPRFKYLTPLLLGTYEEWITQPPCTRSPRGGELVFDIQDPSTGVRVMPPGTEKVNLGRIDQPGNVALFRRHISLRRTLRVKEFEISAEACGFGEGFAGGTFYTDPFGREVRPGPGPNNVKQYIKPGWKAKLNGKWQVGPGNHWMGVHVHGAKDFFLDHGYGINPSVN